jgi:hypothetical protein
MVDNIAVCGRLNVGIQEHRGVAPELFSASDVHTDQLHTNEYRHGHALSSGVYAAEGDSSHALGSFRVFHVSTLSSYVPLRILPMSTFYLLKNKVMAWGGSPYAAHQISHYRMG